MYKIKALNFLDDQLTRSCTVKDLWATQFYRLKLFLSQKKVFDFENIFLVKAFIFDNKLDSLVPTFKKVS